MQYHFQLLDSLVRKARLSPSWRQLRLPLAALGAVLLMLGSARLLIGYLRIGLSLTDSSSPAGFYRLIDAPVRRGELVAACLPNDIERQGLARGYLRGGECSGGAEALLKIVGALAGDEVDIQRNQVSINGRVLAEGRTLSRDTANRPLPHVQ
jgi:conjugative transfer signal peptidase TraF